MARGYKEEEVREKIVDLLKKAKTSLSGVEISKRLNINRVTMAKYLNIFAAEGLIKQKKIGNVTLWFVEEGTEQFHFPDDYFKVKAKFLEALDSSSESRAYSIIRNSLHSGAKVAKIVTEVMLPSITAAKKQYDEGKIGTAELKHLENILFRSLQILNFVPVDLEVKKNVVTLSGDSESIVYSEAASVALRSEGWQVYSLGDMSYAVDVFFDLDLQKFLSKIWKPKLGIMTIVVFSKTEEGLSFFADAVNSVKGKSKNFYLVLCGKLGKKTKVNADLISEDIETILQWSETVYESSVS